MSAFAVVNSKEKIKEVEDPVELMLKKTGCIELHYQVQVRIKKKKFLYRA